MLEPKQKYKYNCLQKYWKLSLLPKFWAPPKLRAVDLYHFSLMINPRLTRKEEVKTSVWRINFGGSFSNVTLFSSQKILLFWNVFRWLRKSWKSGWVFRVGTHLKFVKTFLFDIGPAFNFFLQRRTLLLPVTVEAIELIKSCLKKINCALFSHVYFATLPMPRSCAHLDALGAFGCRAEIGL